MLGNTKSRLFVVLAIAFALVLTVALLFCGCASDTGRLNNDQNTGGESSAGSAVVEGDRHFVNVTGGSYSTTSGVTTATANAGYELAYWNRTKNSVTTKFATTPTVTAGTGESFVPVFVQSSTITQVSTAAALKTAMSNNSNIKLTADITLGSSFAPVATFSGMLDGAGHKITIARSSSSDTNIGGLCGTLTGVIKNVVVLGKAEGTSSSAGQSVGAFAAILGTDGLISQCENYAAVTAKAGIAGGFVAKSTSTTRKSTINSCINRGSVIGASAGAIIFTNGTTSAPLANLENNKNYGGVQTSSIASNS